MRAFWSHIDRNLFVLAMLIIVLAPIPQFLNNFQLDIAVQISLFALLAVAWNLMGGFAGQFSFGHTAFFGIGAYTTAYLVVNRGISPWLGMLLGAALAALFGLFIGYLSFRYGLKGAFFALVTFAFAEMLNLIASNFAPINGAIGLSIPLVSGSSWTMLQFPLGSPNYFYIVLGMLALSLIVVILLMRSRVGMFIQAVREDEDAAAALGINPLHYKLLATMISAALTALGGAFYVQYFFQINPDLAFSSTLSVQILLPAILGGIRTIWGPVLGAVIIILLGQFTVALIHTPPPFLSLLQGRSGLDVVMYSLLLIVIIVAMPRGIFGAMLAGMQRLRLWRS
jgi:branched-chain amino acid transport system permease protein